MNRVILALAGALLLLSAPVVVSPAQAGEHHWWWHKGDKVKDEDGNRVKTPKTSNKIVFESGDHEYTGHEHESPEGNESGEQ
jgi:hypothetical protein